MQIVCYYNYSLSVYYFFNQPVKEKMKQILIVLFLIMTVNLYSEPTMESARKLFYDAVQDEDKLELAIKEFDQIMNKNSKLKGVATTYIGSLTMLKGKHAFWPLKKIAFVNDGIEVMDKGLAIDPKNLESLFIYGSTCFYLPGFLGRSSLADEKLRFMISNLSDENIAKYDPEIMSNALKFLLEKIKLSDAEKSKVNSHLSKIVVNK